MKRFIMAAIMVAALTSQTVAAYSSPKIVGTYSYEEKGCKGTMKVTDGGKYMNFVISTTGPTRYDACDLEGGFGDEDKNGLPTYGQTENGVTHFKAKFYGKKVVFSDVVGNPCMAPNGNPTGKFTGKWIKTK